ncbi:hypothetical protein ES707_19178 [subsurface metagenome]
MDVFVVPDEEHFGVVSPVGIDRRHDLALPARFGGREGRCQQRKIEIGFGAVQICLIEAGKSVDIVDLTDGQALAGAANDVLGLVTQASPQHLNRLGLAVQQEGRMHLDVVTGAQEWREIAEAGIERHLDVVVIDNLLEQIGDDRVDGTDSRFRLAGLRRHDGSEKAGDLRHLADPGVAVAAFDKSQRSGDAAATLACHFPPLSGRKRVEPPVFVEDRFPHVPQAIPAIVLSNAPLLSLRVFTCSGDAPTQAALLGVQNANNN